MEWNGPFSLLPLFFFMTGWDANHSPWVGQKAIALDLVGHLLFFLFPFTSVGFSFLCLRPLHLYLGIFIYIELGDEASGSLQLTHKHIPHSFGNDLPV